MERHEVIYGDKIFFNFIEVPYENLEQSGDLAGKLKTQEVHGFVIRNVFPEEEVAEVKKALFRFPDEHIMQTPASRLFPAPFAAMSDSGSMLDMYFNRLNVLYEIMEKEPAIKALHEKMDSVFKAVAKNYKVSIPRNKIKHAPVSAGTFRIFTPGKGGLHVHCGNLFQAQSEHFYNLIENDVDRDDQLSYFLVLQNSESGGELTIYDMLWDKVKRKESPEENDFVIDDNDRKIYLTDVPSFSVRPKVGDILMFCGGPIWHRVENIGGPVPRITFGGFLNYSNDNNELFYYS